MPRSILFTFPALGALVTDYAVIAISGGGPGTSMRSKCLNLRPVVSSSFMAKGQKIILNCERALHSNREMQMTREASESNVKKEKKKQTIPINNSE